jgi:glutamate N-acetyltransferase/amino-acid N-acetyltransferase
VKEISGGVCAPKGFLAGGIRCGIKESSSKKDLALIYSQKVCTAAAVFTRNKVKAASVQISQQHIMEGKLHAIIVNSGNANACTGETGMEAARRMAQLTAEKFDIKMNEVAVASTGVIGVPLPIKKIEDGFNLLKESLRGDEQGHTDALEAIMTTDTRKKEIAVEFEIDGKKVRLGAMTKGSGMMHPNMATMLTFFTTDAAIEKDSLDAALRLAVKRSFNRLTIDGDTSNNDMVVIMANGEAGNTPVTTVDAGYEVFYNALEKACITLARKMARDGEGATKLITVNVTNASGEDTAEVLAKSVVSSNLVKAACFGADANWGRVLCAMGYGADNAGVDFTPEKVDVIFSSNAGEVLVCKNGGSVPFSEEKAKEILLQEEININIDLHDGTEIATAWGCDLTYDYVKINGDYRS